MNPVLTVTGTPMHGKNDQIRSDGKQTREKEKKTAAEHWSMGYPRRLDTGIARKRIESGKREAVSRNADLW